MVDCEVEKFTAESATTAGLIEAIKRGETIIQGSYILADDGFIQLRQRNFTFTDKQGGLRVGKFADTAELINFAQKVNDYED